MWLRDDIVRPSHSDFASPVVLTKKKGGHYRVCIDYRRLSAYPLPQNVKQIQGFLGLTGFFRKYIEGYATIALPLTKLTKKDAAFIFGVNKMRAFEALKNKLTNKPILQLYDPTAVTELHTDACKDGYAAMLMQRTTDRKELLPVYYYSKQTTSSESNYDSYTLEALAVARAVEKFRAYLLGIPFKIVTDCQAFENTLKKSVMPSNIREWAMMLQEFDFQIEHRAGIRMRHVDALSRARR